MMILPKMANLPLNNIHSLTIFDEMMMIISALCLALIVLEPTEATVLVPRQAVLVLTPECCVLSGEATNPNIDYLFNIIVILYT